jgi:hypothetical protein
MDVVFREHERIAAELGDRRHAGESATDSNGRSDPVALVRQRIAVAAQAGDRSLAHTLGDRLGAEPQIEQIEAGEYPLVGREGRVRDCHPGILTIAALYPRALQPICAVIAAP